MKKSVIVVLSVLGALVVLGCLGVVTSVLSSDDPPPATMIDQSPATQKAVSSPFQGDLQIGDGDWLVGKDMKPGKYKSTGASDNDFPACAWAVKASEDQNAPVVDVGGTDKAKAPQRVTLKTGQVFQTTGCVPWIKQ